MELHLSKRKLREKIGTDLKKNCPHESCQISGLGIVVNETAWY